IGIPPMSDMAEQPSIVTIELDKKISAETPKNPQWEAQPFLDGLYKLCWVPSASQHLYPVSAFSIFKCLCTK
ncbi:MAG: hypothetical protein KGJ09_10810, partial [Candidatus Omnitrophica bacterium]|nr:hypothetical protein [Candidatus Omnitrophota bacterium]